MNQVVRIIGGKYRGKKLSFPALEGLRPTPDRVRETLFNWLMHSIVGARCLDAFAGSGALGFEAFSRGASEVIFIEQAKKAYEMLLRNLASLPRTADELKVFLNSAENYFRNYQGPAFDIIFLDPPFADNFIPSLLELIQEKKLLEPGGLVYLEAPDKLALNPACWAELKLKKAGRVSYGLYQATWAK